jgi:hypothetical protein
MIQQAKIIEEQHLDIEVAIEATNCDTRIILNDVDVIDNIDYAEVAGEKDKYNEVIYHAYIFLYTIAVIIVACILILVSFNLYEAALKITCDPCLPDFKLVNTTICLSQNTTTQYEAKCQQILQDPNRSKSIASLFFGILFLIIGVGFTILKILFLCK